jgi:hypothetical protein
LDLFLGRHDARTRGFDLDQGVFHLLDHEPDQFLGIFCLVQHGVDVRADDITESRKDTHDVPSGSVALASFLPSRAENMPEEETINKS